MQLSNKQVIALFLSSASAVTITEVMNSNCSADTVAAGTDVSLLATCSSMTTCTTDADCTTSGEKCGSIIEDDVAQASLQSFCVHNTACKNIGMRDGNQWYVECANADITTVAADTIPDPMELLRNLQGVVTYVPVSGLGDFEKAQNLKVMSWDNYQDGWWILGDDGLWKETDKPVINLCSTADDCQTGESCGNWPDTNNMRCVNATTYCGKQATVLPLTPWTVTCVAGTDSGPPISAEDDLADESLAQAAQAIDSFTDLVKETMKEKDGYATMTDADKAKWDEEYGAKEYDSKLRKESDKTEAGFDDMTIEQKTVYEADLLEWMKETWEACQENKDSIECTKKWEIRKEQQMERNANGFYAKSADDRKSFDDGLKDIMKSKKAGLTAAWIKDNKPAKGSTEEWAPCSATDKCANPDHCCGTADPRDGKNDPITGVCSDKNTREMTATKLKMVYYHECGAKALIASAATFIASTYLM